MFAIILCLVHCANDIKKTDKILIMDSEADTWFFSPEHDLPTKKQPPLDAEITWFYIKVIHQGQIERTRSQTTMVPLATEIETTQAP